MVIEANNSGGERAPNLEELADSAVFLDHSRSPINERLGGRGIINFTANHVRYFMRGDGEIRGVDILTFKEPLDLHTARFYRWSENRIAEHTPINLDDYRPQASGHEVVDLLRQYPLLVS